jgi:hypothetical protein
MDEKTFSLFAGLIFAVVALFHLVRIFAEWTIIIGDWSVPKSVSWVALVVAGGLALTGLRISQQD